MTVSWRSGDESRVVVQALLFTAAVLVLFGAYLLFASQRPLMGALIMAAGVIDGLMAWGFARRMS